MLKKKPGGGRTTPLFPLKNPITEALILIDRLASFFYLASDQEFRMQQSIMSTLPLLLLLLFSSLFPAPSHAWGIHGHLIVCQIAQARTFFRLLPRSAPRLLSSDRLVSCRAGWATRPPRRWGACCHRTPGATWAASVPGPMASSSGTPGRRRSTTSTPRTTSAATPTTVCWFCPQIRLKFAWTCCHIVAACIMLVSCVALSGDCKDEDSFRGRCVAGSINNYTSQLLTYDATSPSTQCNTAPFNSVLQFFLPC